jgi:UDP-perosamine 4-acetyltransferase
MNNMREKLVVVGSSGHAKVLIDILRDTNKHMLIGCTNKDGNNVDILGLPVIGDDSVLPRLYDEGVHCAFIAIGDNERREKMAEHLASLGFIIVNAVSPHAHLSGSVRLGKGIAVMAGAVINPDTTIGDNAIINTGATVDHDCMIGASVHIAPGCNLAGNVSIGRGAFLGIGCKVIPKISIGEWTIIGAGSVVVSDLPAHSLAYGVPAKVIRKL